MKHILFLTSTSLGTNPRIVKEIKVCLEHNYNVSAICFQFDNWSKDFDDVIRKNLANANILLIPATRKPFLQWIYLSILEKVCRFLLLHYDLNVEYLAFAVSRRSILLLRALRKVKRADLVIGHNAGSIYPTLFAAKKFGARSIFDFEDYHSGELIDGNINNQLIHRLESACIPHFDSLTSASPLISSEYKNIYPTKNICTINNYFTKCYAVEKNVEIAHLPLKIFWFSQNIGTNRGLEIFIKAMSYFPKGSIRLTLLGYYTKEIYDHFHHLLNQFGVDEKQLYFLHPVSEEEITKIASTHHIGIASELSTIKNRDICLTNKLFMYLLSGNAIVASDTAAQKAFCEENPNIGLCYEQNNIESLVEVLEFYYYKPYILEQHRRNALDLSKNKMNWEIEQNIFLDNIKKVLS